MESLLWIELGDFGRSLTGKYPLSESSISSAIKIKSCDVQAVRFVYYGDVLVKVRALTAR